MITSLKSGLPADVLAAAAVVVATVVGATGALAMAAEDEGTSVAAATGNGASASALNSAKLDFYGRFTSSKSNVFSLFISIPLSCSRTESTKLLASSQAKSSNCYSGAIAASIETENIAFSYGAAILNLDFTDLYAFMFSC